MYKGSIEQMTFRISKVERMLVAVEEKIELLDQVDEWSAEQEVEYFQLCDERDYLQKEFNELHEVLA